MRGRILLAAGLLMTLAGPVVAKDKTDAGNDLSAWMGMWMAGPELQISIAPGIGGGLNIDAHAIFSTSETAEEIGAINVGAFAGTVPAAWIDKGQVRIASSGEEIIPLDKAGKEDCVVDMSLVSERILLVTDNGRCGGLNVSFNGTYNPVD